MHFMGTYTPKIDEKGRLFLPAKFRNRLAEGLVVTQGQEKCLVVWPQDVFDAEADRVSSRPQTSKAARAYTRMLFSSGAEGSLDKQGRIGLPTSLRDYAGLDRDVVVIGARDRLEMWNPERWREYEEQTLPDYVDLDEDEE